MRYLLAIKMFLITRAAFATSLSFNSESGRTFRIICQVFITKQKDPSIISDAKILIGHLNLMTLGICCQNLQQMPGFDMRPAGAPAILFLFCTEVLHYFPCDNQSDYRWHKCHTSRNISSLRTFMLCSWRTDTVVSAADCHVLDWSGRFLF